jgi:hypothetical protein
MFWELQERLMVLVLSLFLHKPKTSSCDAVCENKKGMPPLSQKLLEGEVQ